MDESRRGARVATTFLVAIEGLDVEPTLRKGDISTTGTYFETSQDVGGVGTIHMLNVLSADRARSVHVMAYVVRTLHLADAGGRRVGGAAFEFMPESDEAATALNDLVRHVLAVRHGTENPHIEPRLAARAATSGAGESATVRALSVRSMVLETSWAIAPGERVRVDIVAPGMTRRIRLEGRAVRVLEKRATSPSSYDIEVAVHEESERPLRTQSSMTMPAVRPLLEGAALVERGIEDDESSRTLEDLLSALILPPERDGPRNRHHHLSGQLLRIRLPTLAAMFEMERMTGKLVIKRDIEEARLWFRDGQIVDVEPVALDETRRARLTSLLAWSDGSFEFYVEPVERPNAVKLSTTALLIDLAREEDEAGRGPGF